MQTFAGIASEGLSADEAALLGSMLPPGAHCENSPMAVLGAENGAAVVSLGDSARRVTALFSGRLENADELHRRLVADGHQLQGSSPAELLVHLYEKHGSDVFTLLKGAFAAAVYDGGKHRLLLGRDVIGIEPLYYFIHRGVLVFSNRLPVLARHPLIPTELDINAVSVFLSLQYIPDPDTIYRNVRKLPPGHLLEARLDSANTSIRSFRKIDFAAKRRDLTFADACAEMRKRVEEAVESELAQNADTGVFLSGGVDSAVLAALSAKHSGGRKVEVFTVGYNDPAYDERELAKESLDFINAHSGDVLKHHIRELETPTFELAEELAEFHGEPYADVSVLPTHLLCKFAREKIGAAFGGDGADEFFAGYERYNAMRIAGAFDLLPLSLRHGVFSLLAGSVRDAGERTLRGRTRRMCKLIAAPSHSAYFSLLDRAPAETKKALLGPELNEALWNDVSEVFGRREWELTAADPAEGYSELDIHTYLPGDGCAKLEIAAGAAGMEVVTPYLRSSVTEFAAKLPFEYKMLGKNRKRILKAAFADLLPPAVARRRKRGFGSPMAAWLRREWRPGAERILFESPLCRDGYVVPETLRQLWQEHRSGKADYSYLLWSLINLAWFLERR